MSQEAGTSIKDHPERDIQVLYFTVPTAVPRV